MGVFTPAVRRSYAPPLDDIDASGNSSNKTLLGAGDPNLIRVANDPPTQSGDEQVAQQRPNPSPLQRKPVGPPTLPATSQPGRGYGTMPQAIIERGMTKEQKMINRSQALLEVAKQPPPSNAELLPDDWQTTKSPDLVDDLQRAAQRHNVADEAAAPRVGTARHLQHCILREVAHDRVEIMRVECVDQR